MKLLNVLAIIASMTAFATREASASIIIQADSLVRAKPTYVGGSMIEYHDVPSALVTNSPIDYQQNIRDDKCKMIRMGAYPSPRNSAETLANFDAKVQAILNSGAVPLFYAPIQPGLASYYKTDGTLGGTSASNVAYLVSHYLAAPFNLTTQYWEVGNEPDLTVDYQVPTVQEYIDDFNAVHNALVTAGTRNNVKLCGPVVARSYHQGVTNGFSDQIIDQLLTQCHDSIDVLTLHTYQSMSTTVTADNLLNAPAKFDNEFDATRTVNPTDFNYASKTANMGPAGIVAKMQSSGLTFARNPGFGITEHNSAGTGLHTIYAGLWQLGASQMFLYNGSATLPTVLDTTFIYDHKGTEYGVPLYNADATYDYSHWALWINGNLRGTTTVNRTVSGNLNPSGNSYLLTCATKDTGNLYVEVINRSASAISDTVTINGANGLGAATVYTMSATSTPDTGTPQTLGSTFTYSFPAYSATIFKFVTGNPPATNLALWLRADAGVTANLSGAVSAWADQSSNGRNATQTTSTSQPGLQLSALNGKPAVYFDGGDTLTLSTGISSAAYQVFAVIKPDTGLANGASIVSGGGSSFQYRLDTTYKQKVNKATVVAIGASNTAVSTSAFSRVATSYSSPNLAFWLAGTPDGTTSSAQTFTTALTSIGSRAGSEFFKGYIAELLVYSAPLSESDRQQVESYLNLKYGI